MFKVPERARVTGTSMMASTKADGNNGVFKVYFKYGRRKSVQLNIICSDVMGWAHVSIVAVGKKRVPTYRELAYVKSLFWDEEDTVVQYFPKKSEHINNHEFCLHLFQSLDKEMPTPPTSLIGVKTDKPIDRDEAISILRKGIG